jgi:hypothetical protein
VLGALLVSEMPGVLVKMNADKQARIDLQQRDLDQYLNLPQGRAQLETGNLGVLKRMYPQAEMPLFVPMNAGGSVPAGMQTVAMGPKGGPTTGAFVMPMSPERRGASRARQMADEMNATFPIGTHQRSGVQVNVSDEGQVQVGSQAIPRDEKSAAFPIDDPRVPGFLQMGFEWTPMAETDSRGVEMGILERGKGLDARTRARESALGAGEARNIPLTHPDVTPDARGKTLEQRETEIENADRLQAKQDLLSMKYQQNTMTLADDAEFIMAQVAPITNMIPSLPDKTFVGLPGAVKSAGRKTVNWFGTALELESASLPLAIKSAAALSVANIARRFGEKGVLTDLDVKRFMDILDVSNSSQQSAAVKMGQVNAMAKDLAARAARKAAGNPYLAPPGEVLLSPADVEAIVGSLTTGGAATVPIPMGSRGRAPTAQAPAAAASSSGDPSLDAWFRGGGGAMSGQRR